MFEDSPCSFGSRVRGHPLRVASAFISHLRAFVYIDGFNLYYGALRETPYKWLNPFERFPATRFLRSSITPRSSTPGPTTLTLPRDSSFT